jgi:hypothetical protein
VAGLWTNAYKSNMGFVGEFMYIGAIGEFWGCSKEKALLMMKGKLERQIDL